MTNWPSYTRTLLTSATIIGVAVLVFILVMDPYQNVPFSPPLDRAPISSNQRFAYPAIARDEEYDSLVLGTSTTRLLNPAGLAPGAARFANLSMNSATAHEQMRIHEVFVRHHPAMKYLVIGIDGTWCDRSATPQRYTFRAFPEWMYDENRYNDLLYIFNDKALENAVRMLELFRGRREPKYDRNGYHDFSADFNSRDEAGVLERLDPLARSKPVRAAVRPRRARSGNEFPSLASLADLLARTPSTTRIVLLLPPLHVHFISRKRALFSECKGKLLERVQGDHRIDVLDYFFASELTRSSQNYWDILHFTRAVALLIEDDISNVLAGRAPHPQYARFYSHSEAD